MTLELKRFQLLLCIAVLTLTVCGSTFAANLLVNGSFESGPYGVQFDRPDAANPSVQGVWYSEGADADNLFNGIFDSTWHNPAEQPGWPTTFAPFDGSYYLGRYNPNQPFGAPTGGRLGAAYQIVPVTEGTTYYLTAWHVGFHPQGGGAGVRIGIDPTGTVTPETGRPEWGSPNIVWFPEETLDNEANKVKNFDTSTTWKKLQASAAAAPGATQAIVWIQYTMTSNNLSQPQIVQVDNVSFSTQQSSLMVRDVIVTGISNTSYKATWRVTDGTADVAATCSLTLNTPTGPANKSVSYNSETKLYTCTMTSLAANTAYTFTINATAQNYDPGVYNGSFSSYPVLILSNPVVSNVTQTGATISWDTTDKVSGELVATTGLVTYGENFALSATDTPGPNPTLTAHHSVTLSGLLPNTIYNFKCYSDRPAGSTNPGPYGMSYQQGSFQTPGGQFFNGDFEQANKYPINIGDAIPGWTKFNNAGYLGDPSWFANGEWAIPAQHGGRYIGYTSNYGGTGNGGVYQNFSTTPGEMIVMSAWVWAESWSPNGFKGITGDGPHRFGTTSCRIGIDPTGQTTDPGANTIVWSSDRETIDWTLYSSGIFGNRNWQKIQSAAVATGPNATVFLKMDSLWTDPWLMMCFDNVTKETGTTPVSSVAAAKQLDNDTAITLSGNVVVTYVADASDLMMSENYQAPYFYIQDEEGTAGIKVVMSKATDPLPEGIAPGKRVSLDGIITWGAFYNPTMARYDNQQQRLDKPCGERVIKILPGRITVGADGVMPKAVGMSNKALCGGSSSDHWFTNPGVDGGTGPNNVGRLARIWGRLVFAGVSIAGSHVGRYYVVIDDGSGVPRFGSTPSEATTGVFIDVGTVGYADSTFYDLSSHMGEYAMVTGIAAPALDYDWDDWTGTAESKPEALKNVRTIKPLSFTAPHFTFMPAQ